MRLRTPLSLTIFLSLIMLPAIIFAYTETFYICHGGDGSLPETATCGTAWDEADFNNAANWANGTDSNDGKIGANDIVYLMDDGGSFVAAAGNFVLEAQASGSTGKLITLKNYTGDAPVIDGQSARLMALSVYAKSYIIVDGLTLQNGSLWGLYGAEGQSNVTVQNCTIEGDGYGVQFYISGAAAPISDITLDNNTITGSGHYGVSFYADGGSDFSNIAITNNTISAATEGDYGGIAIGVIGGAVTGIVDISDNKISQAGAYGMILDGDVGLGFTALVTVNNNTIHDWSQNQNDRGAIHLIHFSNNTVTVSGNVIYNGSGNFQSGALYADTWTNVTSDFSYNYVHDCKGPGIQVYLADGAVFHHNILENTCKDDSDANYHGEVLIMAAAGDTASSNKLYNNIIYMDDNTQQTFAVQIEENSGTVAGNEIKNNIIYHDGAAGYDYIYNSDDTTADIDWNLYWPPISTSEMHYCGTSYYSFAAWRAARPDNNGKEADPKFVNAAVADFTLASTSPAINLGVNLGSSYDDALNPSSSWPSSVSTLDQDDYGMGWEIGAYVYRDGDWTEGALPPSKPQNLQIKD